MPNPNLTKEYFDRQLTQLNKRLDGFATKNDFKDFVTKDDLKPFATKNDLKAFATKQDLKVFGIELREEMKALEQRLVGQTEELAAMVKRGLDEISEKLDVRERVARHDRDIRMIKEALHIATR